MGAASLCVAEQRQRCRLGIMRASGATKRIRGGAGSARAARVTLEPQRMPLMRADRRAHHARDARPRWRDAITARLIAFTLVAAFVAGCSTLPPGADYPKTVSTALA